MLAVREEQMLPSMLDRHVDEERATAVVAEESEQHVPDVESRTHSSPEEVHLLRRPLHELEASPEQALMRCGAVARSARTVGIVYMILFVLG